MGSARKLHPLTKRASLDKLTDEEKLERRKERLIGRWVKGVLIRNRQNFSVKWNDCQFDNVYVSRRSVELSLGPRPARGIVAVVRCQIKTMGPTSAPWYLQHPYTDTLALVTRYLRKRRGSRRWVHSGMTWATGTPFTNSPSYSNAATLPPSKNPSPEGSRRASVVDIENVPTQGATRIVSRRGSSLYIDGGKRWEFKPPVAGPQVLPIGWSMRPVRHGGCTYFVPSPPGSKRNTRRYRQSRARSGRKGRDSGRKSRARDSGRKSKGPKGKKPKSRRPSEQDRLKAEKLIKLIEAQERREAERKSSSGSRKGSRKKSAKKKKKPPASARKPTPKKTKKGKKSKSGRQSKLRRETRVKGGMKSVKT